MSGLTRIGLYGPVQGPKVMQLSTSKVFRCQGKQVGAEWALLKGSLQRVHPAMQRMCTPACPLMTSPFGFIICCYHVPYSSKLSETKPKLIILPAKMSFPTAEETVPYLNPRPQTSSPACLQVLPPELGILWTLRLMLSLVKRQETQVLHRIFYICRNFGLGAPQISRSVDKSSSQVYAHLLHPAWTVYQPFLDLFLVPPGKAGPSKVRGH